jgi:hypothetical protein
MTTSTPKKRIATTVCALLTILLTSAPTRAAAVITTERVKNLKVHVPSMGDGPGDWIQFKNGNGIKNKTVGWAKMKSVAIGTAGNTPFAVSHVTWHGTTGSGYWNTLILFKELRGKISQTGIYPHCIGSTDKIEIKQNRIFVHLSDSEDYGGFLISPGIKKEGKGWISFIPSTFTP